jgi:ABC-2 type transport system permease protein
MKAYWAVFSARFRMMLQYRAAALAGLGTQVFWGWIRVMILGAFYEAVKPGTAAPLSFAQVVTYVWLGQATIRLMPFRASGEIAAMIRDGTVAYELARPVGLYSLWYARAVADMVAPALLRAVPMVAMAIPFFGMSWPASPAAGAMWAVSTTAAVLLSAAFVTLLSILLLWTISGDGLAQVLPPVAWMFSGMVLPLPLFPDWAQGFIWLLPFRDIMDVPFRIYMGDIGPAAWPGALAHQAVWTVLMVAIGWFALARGVRRLVVQGG